MLVLEDVGLLTREAAVVHRKAGALDVGTRRIAVAAHAVQGRGWPDASRHLFCDNQAEYICDTLGVIGQARPLAHARRVRSSQPMFLLDQQRHRPENTHCELSLHRRRRVET